ncbi:hypothetical protein AUEXF2481DRAFT_38460 [Aureobasidium subglaciale EXF-2481]|uniref:Uncharacterized protein n=1 Tax=Aureobasidium subglaciale (strain EXF-2481) TaxID=1043005 RepID=A0A074ZEJ2_AURSE|nr:uncharacterized protein AUEXF2481DRAFT_38460 [Aureobasidium subglaciale EXF-2481]KEQ97061.1 hypothetical protein AUEXF2481DRAFT_38460 [Aureobasidium subglaciale EXF-2481]
MSIFNEAAVVFLFFFSSFCFYKRSTEGGMKEKYGATTIKGQTYAVMGVRGAYISLKVARRIACCCSSSPSATFGS